MCAVPTIAVFFLSSLISWLAIMLLRYFLNDFEMVPFARIITSIFFSLLLLLLLMLLLLLPLHLLVCLFCYITLSKLLFHSMHIK